LKRSLNVLYVGDDTPDDADAMLYYLRRALEADRTVAWQVRHRAGGRSIGGEEIDAADAVVLVERPNPTVVRALRAYLESGGTALLVLASTQAASVLADLTGRRAIECQEAPVQGYAMLGRLDFQHPLLQPFAEPRFADFTRIHFWRYRKIALAEMPDTQVLARYDNNDPAWFDVGVGRGRLLVWTSGWHPTDSDLSLSSKFVPLLYSVLRYGGVRTDQPSQYFVGDPVPRETLASARSTDIVLRKPDGQTVSLEADEPAFTQTDQPGIYTVVTSTRERAFAVNVPVAESRTDPMPIEDLERFGVSLAPVSDVPPVTLEAAAQRTSFRDMESRQKLWRWALLAALAVLLAETWLGGRLARRGTESGGEGS
jgi:hypothetical protein